MRVLFAITSLFLAVRASTVQAQVTSTSPSFPSAVFDTTYSGVWTGLVDPAQRAMVRRVVVRLTKTIRGTCDAIVNLPSQRVMNAQASYASCTNETVALAVPFEDISFSGRLDSASMTINGTWNQNGQAYPLLLRKLQGIAPPPQPKLAGVALPLRIHNQPANVELEGELVVPDQRRKWPLVVLLYDAGPQDRDGEAWDQRPLFDAANALARQGWASFRMDDRGVGNSTGSMANTGIDDLAGDVLAALSTLSRHPNVDTSRIVLLGLGEGGIVAAAAAAKSPLVRGIVALSAPSLDGITLLKEQIDADQRSRGTSPRVIAAYKQTVAEWYSAVAADLAPEQVANVIVESASELLVNHIEAADIAAIKPFLTEQRDAYVQNAVIPWLRTFHGISPGPYFRSVATPVYAMFAGDDPVVPAQPNASAMRQWLDNRPFSMVEIVPGHNHRFQRCYACTLEEMEYLPESIDIGIIDKVLSWASALPATRSSQQPATRP